LLVYFWVLDWSRVDGLHWRAAAGTAAAHVRSVPILLQKSAISEVSGKPIVFEVVGF